MKIEDTFRVDVPIDEAWRVLLDLERIAPCMPGAELQEVEGDEYRGVVKVKVGPITAQYKGVARLAEVDEANRRAVIDAQGRDTRGQGNAKAAITISLTELSGGATEVSVDNNVTITGKVAQFGRGVMADVSSKLLAQFVECLEANVLGCPPGAEAEAAVAPAPVEPVDLLRTAGAPVLKRLLPVIAVVGVIVVVILVLLLR
jgi:carbon monoxide dehydrogenase subunit G